MLARLVHVYGSLTPKKVSDTNHTVYDNLPLEHHDSIRLLELNSVFGQLKATLKCVRLSEVKTQYSALSYTWDQNGKNRIIELNGRSFSIGATIYQFLMDLQRSLEVGTPLWVDTICINQTSDSEKGHQVSMMGRIYQNAKETVIWLGNTRRDRNAMRQIGPLAHDTQLRSVYYSWDWSELAKVNHDRRQSMREAAAHLSRKKYWTRGWIIQELQLAHSVTVCCGGTMYSGRCLEHVPNHSGTGKANPHLQELFRGLRSSQAFKTDCLCQLLSRYHQAECSLPRDRVFALLGLIKDRNDPLFQDVDAENGHNNSTASDAMQRIVDYSVSEETLLYNIVQLYSCKILSTEELIIPLFHALELNQAWSLLKRSEENLIPVDLYRIHEVHDHDSSDAGSGIKQYDRCFGFYSEKHIPPLDRWRGEFSDPQCLYSLRDIVLVCNVSGQWRIEAVVSRFSHLNTLVKLEGLVAVSKRRKLQSIVERIKRTRIEPYTEVDDLVHTRDEALDIHRNPTDSRWTRVKLSLYAIRALSDLNQLLKYQSTEGMTAFEVPCSSYEAKIADKGRESWEMY